MRLCLSATLITLVFSLGCASTNKEPRVVRTQIITVPDGALVEFNGKPAGRAPAHITLPQDEHGNLTEKAELLILPNSDQPALFPQRRVFDPSARDERVPNRILVDMTKGSTNYTQVASGAAAQAETSTSTRKSARPPVPYTNRGKPTQSVGLDRWSPGIY
jgi:hypothetical protein